MPLEEIPCKTNAERQRAINSAKTGFVFYPIHESKYETVKEILLKCYDAQCNAATVITGGNAVGVALTCAFDRGEQN